MKFSVSTFSYSSSSSLFSSDSDEDLVPSIESVYKHNIFIWIGCVFIRITAIMLNSDIYTFLNI